MMGSKPLGKLTDWVWFRLAILIPLSFSIVLWLLAKPWSYEFSFTFEGYKHAYELFSVPIIFSGLAITLSVLAGLIHKSYQTDESIKITREANRFQDALRHRHMFMSEIRSSLSDGVLKGWNISRLYRDLFPNILNADYTPQLRPEWKRLVREANRFDKNPSWNLELLNELSNQHGELHETIQNRCVELLYLLKESYQRYEDDRYYEEAWAGSDPSDIDEFYQNIEAACVRVSERLNEFGAILTSICESFVDYFCDDEFRGFASTVEHRDLRYTDYPDPLFQTDEEFDNRIDSDDYSIDRPTLIAASLYFGEKPQT